ncbi:MAG: DUF6809 family protein [Oscillospiraceae bacterium]|jgi:uncharacterized protein YggL (DUF469 family)
MEFIKRLFNGNINPSVAVTVKGSQYEKLANGSVNVQKMLCGQLSEEQKKLIKELISIQDTLSMIVSEENYSAGFRDGAGMIMDVIMGKNSNLKEL